MIHYLASSGKIIYDPFRANMKKRTEGWCVINVDKEITRYYRWWLEFQYHIHLQPPSWDAHISIVRGERILKNKQGAWLKYDRKRIDFTYGHGAIRKYRSTNIEEKTIPGFYYVMPVVCPKIDEIRQELGLKPFHTYHLTIGRTYEYQARIPKNLIKKVEC